MLQGPLYPRPCRTPEEIAAKMDVPVDKVRKVLKIAQEPISLETPIGEEEDSHLGDFIRRCRSFLRCFQSHHPNPQRRVRNQ